MIIINILLKYMRRLKYGFSMKLLPEGSSMMKVNSFDPEAHVLNSLMTSSIFAAISGFAFYL